MTKPAARLDLDDCLYTAFKLEALIGQFADCISETVEFDRLGLAARVNQSELEVRAFHSKGSIQPHHTGRRFPYRGTVGEWVWKRKQPFIGRQRKEVRAFPVTYKQFETEGMESNCVIALPLPDQGPTFVYWLSRRRDCYDGDSLPQLLRACEYLKPLLSAAGEIDRVSKLSGRPLDRALNQLFTAGRPDPDSRAALPTLEEVQGHYIRGVLAATHWQIEGAEGAAAVLGLPASTLRSRMKKLGISR